MMRILLSSVLFFCLKAVSAQTHPQGYFRNPLNIPMQLVANFGEIRTNHWHMGLDIRTQQRVNLPVYAAAEGYVSRVVVEPGGFGQAIYIAHPNGYTTLYAHLNAFFPALAQWVKDQQYSVESWEGNFYPKAGQFPLEKGQFIGLSGSTGGSQGPHVHFEIRDSKTEACYNPLLFGMPIADAVPPTVGRLALYDRSRSTYRQAPQFVAAGNLIRVGSRRISFAAAATDRFSGSNNPNGIFSGRQLVDGGLVSEFRLDNIGYDDTRAINAQIDYPYKTRGGGDLQHFTPLPGARQVAYKIYNDDGSIHLNDDAVHEVTLEVSDAAGNTTKRTIRVQYEPTLSGNGPQPGAELLLPNNVNVFERPDFELYTSERTVYDTATIAYAASESAPDRSRIYTVVGANIPAHDSVTVRIQWPSAGRKDRTVLINKAGSKTFVQRARWNGDWAMARFRQFGTYQAVADEEPPTVNAPPTSLRGRGSLIFVPHDNLEEIRSLRLEVDGRWLRCSNDKGHSWIYTFDEHFPSGTHDLKITVEDEAGNKTIRSYTVTR